MLEEANADVGVSNLLDFFPELARLDLQGLRRHIEGLFLRLHTMVSDQIERRLRERAFGGDLEKKNFLDVLLDYRDTNDG